MTLEQISLTEFIHYFFVINLRKREIFIKKENRVFKILNIFYMLIGRKVVILQNTAKALIKIVIQSNIF